MNSFNKDDGDKNDKDVSKKLMPAKIPHYRNTQRCDNKNSKGKILEVDLTLKQNMAIYKGIEKNAHSTL